MKKIISILAVAMLAASIVTGCGGNDTQTPQDNQKTTENATVSTDGSTSMEKSYRLLK